MSVGARSWVVVPRLGEKVAFLLLFEWLFVLCARLLCFARATSYGDLLLYVVERPPNGNW